MKQFLLIIISFFTGYLYAADIVPGQTYKMSAQVSGSKTLCVKNASLNKDADVQIWTETNVNAQRWIITPADNNMYQFTNAYSGKILYRKGTAADGAKICQYDKDDLTAGKWEITPVDGPAGYFYISQMDKNNVEKLYLELLDTADGSLLELHTKKSGADAVWQIWKLDAVDAQSNRLTSAIQEDMMQGWKNKYYKKASQGYVLGGGGFWGDAEMFEAVLDAYETTGSPVHEDMFKQLYSNFTYRKGTYWLSNEYNDDIAWIVIASVRAYLMFGDQSYLYNAKSNFDAMYSRALLPSGMLRWKESSETINGTNSCINGPAEVAACYLGQATKDDTYYTKAKDLYALQRKYLYVPSSGQVYDSFSWVNNVPSGYNYWASTYNQGTFLGAAVMLYNRYGDEQYKQDAQMIMKYTTENLCDANGIISVCQVATGDLAGFKGILMRYARRFIVDLGHPEYVEWMQKNALQAYNTRNSSGVSSSAWLTKTPENYIFQDWVNQCISDCEKNNNCKGTYVSDCGKSHTINTDPFGPSTAVSAAFNAPLDKNLIFKDAFSRIEAENFDYIKGVHVKAGTDDTTPNLENIKDGFYTGYNNVNFGNNLATGIEVRVSKAELRSTLMKIYLDSPSGTLIGTITLPREGDDWQTYSCPLTTPVDGMHNVYIVYGGTSGYELAKFNYFRFTADSYTYPDITDNGGLITSSHELSDSGLQSVIDNRLSTVSVITTENNQERIWLTYQSPVPVWLKGYALGVGSTRAYDPKSWNLQASNNGNDWVDLDTQSGQVFDAKYQKKQYDVSTTMAYTYFRLNVTERVGHEEDHPLLRKALYLSEWQLYGGALFDKDITADGGVLTTQYPGTETEGTAVKLTDKAINSKYRVSSQSDLWIDYKSNANYKLASYSLTSADNTPESDPKNWILYASGDGQVWTEIDRQINQQFPYRNVTQTYFCTVDAGYRYFRLHITANNGSSDTQLAEWQLMGNYYYDYFYHDITHNGGELTSSQDLLVNSENLKALTDNNGNTQYVLRASNVSTSTPAWIQYKSTTPVQLRAYSISIGDDINKTPRNWTLQVSNDGTQWSTLNTRSNITYALRGERKVYEVSTSNKFTYFRINITRLTGDDADEVRLTEWELHGTGILADDVTANGGVIESEYAGNSSSERVEKLKDKLSDTKYCGNFSTSSWFSYQSTVPAKVTAYSITSANDNPSRDPKDWVLEASSDGNSWVEIDSRKDQLFPYRYVTQFYSCNKAKTEYTYFRLNVTGNNGANLLQFAEWQLLEFDVNTSIPQAPEKQMDIRIYPNPVSDYLYVDMPENGRIEIYSIAGRLIFAQNAEAGVKSIPVGEYGKGLYLIRIKSEEKIVNKKFIKR